MRRPGPTRPRRWADPVDQWVYDETDRILKAYGNHPSFLLMPYGNEPAGKTSEYLANWVDHCKDRDPRRLYTSGSGWPQTRREPVPRHARPAHPGLGRAWQSRINARPPETRPTTATTSRPAACR